MTWAGTGCTLVNLGEPVSTMNMFAEAEAVRGGPTSLIGPAGAGVARQPDHIPMLKTPRMVRTR